MDNTRQPERSLQAEPTTDQKNAGADNLLCKCMGVRSGESVVLVLEPDDSLYHYELRTIVESRIRTLGASVKTVTAELITQPSDFPESIASLMRTAEHTLFLSRLGDYVRFAHLPGNGSKTTSYALTPATLGSPYASICHHLLKQLHDKLEHELMNAKHWHISCPLGTDIQGSFCWPSLHGGLDDELTVTLFPIATFKPVPCDTATGKVALSKWLLPGGAAKLAGADLAIEESVFCHVENGRIKTFSGPNESIRQVSQHYDYISNALQISRDRVHSWHIGINPQTHFNGNPDDDLDKWCAVSFGSPRYLHFHTCGDEPPGEVAWSLFNPTVEIDGVTFWREGQFEWLHHADNLALIKSVEGAQSLTDSSLTIGI